MHAEREARDSYEAGERQERRRERGPCVRMHRRDRYRRRGVAPVLDRLAASCRKLLGWPRASAVTIPLPLRDASCTHVGDR